MRLETVARRIMRKLKGWDKKSMAEDFRLHPKEHTKELQWLIRQLENLPYKPPVSKTLYCNPCNAQTAAECGCI